MLLVLQELLAELEFRVIKVYKVTKVYKVMEELKVIKDQEGHREILVLVV